MHGSKPVLVCPVSFCLHGQCVLELDKDRTLLHSQKTGFFVSVCMRVIVRYQCCVHRHSELPFFSSVGVALGTVPAGTRPAIWAIFLLTLYTRGFQTFFVSRTPLT